MPKCVCRSVLQERGCVLSACPSEGFVGGEELRLLAWSNVINPFSSHVSGRGRAFFWKDEDDAGARSLSLLGRNETVKERETTAWRARVGRGPKGTNATPDPREPRAALQQTELCCVWIWQRG